MPRTLRNIHAAIVVLAIAAAAASCSDNDSFTTSPTAQLTLTADTVRFDTVFSNVPTSYRLFWVRNNNADGLRISNVRLLSGNQSGFRVNVNGTALSQLQGYQANDFELRGGDSLRVFVELTAHTNNAPDGTPQKVADDLLFTLESGRQQRVNLNAYSWDATLLNRHTVTSDTTFATQNARPVVIYDTLRVAKGATLTIAPGTTLYMHPNAAIYVSGTLKCLGTAGNEVTLRSDRLDRLFTYLPYDNTPGRWQGITLDSLSHDNLIQYTDIHSATSAIKLNKTRLTLTHSTVHNIQGNGVTARGSVLNVQNSQISNCLGHCLSLQGDSTTVNQSTLAQFYPFSSARGNALNVVMDTTKYANYGLLKVQNSILTGYADDEFSLQIPTDADPATLNVTIDHSLLRTPQLDSQSPYARFYGEGNIFEDPTDTLTLPRRRFVLFDTDNLLYDFTPQTDSPAVGAADPMTSTSQDDRRGNMRKEKPDMGCFETSAETSGSHPDNASDN